MNQRDFLKSLFEQARSTVHKKKVAKGLLNEVRSQVSSQPVVEGPTNAAVDPQQAARIKILKARIEDKLETVLWSLKSNSLNDEARLFRLYNVINGREQADLSSLLPVTGS